MQVHVVTEELHYDGTTVVAVLSDRDAADALAVKLSGAASPQERTSTSWWVETFVLDALPAT